MGKFMRKRSKISRKMRGQKGGVSFNSVMDFSAIPKNDFYSLNDYNADTSRSPYVHDARLLGGGSRRKRNKSRKMRKSVRSKLMARKYKGGNPFNNDALLGPNYNMNAVSAIGTTAGAGWMANEVRGVNNGGGPTTMYSQNPVAMV